MSADLYKTTDGSRAYAEYTVYVDVGDAEDKFIKFADTLGAAIETNWKDREWK